MGVFAGQAISAGTIIEQCHALPIEQGWERIDTVLNHYLFAWPWDGDGRAVVFGLASVFNHGRPPNAAWKTVLESTRVDFYTLCDVMAGKELLIDYGDEYWQQAAVYSPPQGATERSILPIRLVNR